MDMQGRNQKLFLTGSLPTTWDSRAFPVACRLHYLQSDADDAISRASEEEKRTAMLMMDSTRAKEGPEKQLS
jgi:hypothetical protein